MRLPYKINDLNFISKRFHDQYMKAIAPCLICKEEFYHKKKKMNRRNILTCEKSSCSKKYFNLSYNKRKLLANGNKCGNCTHFDKETIAMETDLLNPMKDSTKYSTCWYWKWAKLANEMACVKFQN